MDEYTCSELLEELAKRLVLTNGIEFCNIETLKDVSFEIIYFLLEQD